MRPGLPGGAVSGGAGTPAGSLPAIPRPLAGAPGLLARLQGSLLASAHLFSKPRLRAPDLSPGTKPRHSATPRGALLQLAGMGTLLAGALECLRSCVHCH
jgi:hypothetical protein